MSHKENDLIEENIYLKSVIETLEKENTKFKEVMEEQKLIIDTIAAFPEKDATVVSTSVKERRAQMKEEEDLKKKMVKELLPNGKSPQFVQLWLDGKYDFGVSQFSHEDQRKAAIEPTKWLIECLKYGYLDSKIKVAADSLLTYYKYTRNLGFLYQWDPFQKALGDHLTDIGEKLKEAYDDHNLVEFLTYEEIKDVIGDPTGLESQVTVIPILRGSLKFTAPLEEFTSERVALHVLMFIAIAVDPIFQTKITDVSKYFVEEDGVKSGPLKTFQRPLTKAKDDYHDKEPPRVASNLDLVRCSVAARDVRSLFKFLKALHHAFGPFPKWKNVFGFSEEKRAKRKHNVSLNITIPFNTKMTYGEMVRNTTITEKWNAYSSKPQGEPTERWERGVAAARALLKNEGIANYEVKMFCEVQTYLQIFSSYGKKSHDAYQAARPETEEQLYWDFIISSGLYKPEPDGGCVFDAARDGQREVVRKLIDAGGDVNDVDKIGRTAAYIATQNEHVDVLCLLIEKGANIDKARNDGMTPLFMAVQNRRSDVVQVLLGNFADIDKPKNNGVTPLYLAAEKGHSDIVRMLLVNGADVNKARIDGCMPLYVAVYNGHSDVVRVLLDNGADVNKPNNNGITPLYLAAEKGHSDVIRVLLGNGADINKAEKGGRTPLFITAQKSHSDIVQVLLGNGADINTPNNNGITPLYIAAQKGHSNVARMLLDNGADVNKAENDGFTPLFIAAQKGHNDVVQVLLAKGADVNITEKSGATPLFMAAQKGHSDVIRLLLGNGADVDIVMNDGNTPLTFSTHCGKFDVVEQILQHGVSDIHHAAQNGYTALALAKNRGYTCIVDTLKQSGATY